MGTVPTNMTGHFQLAFPHTNNVVLPTPQYESRRPQTPQPTPSYESPSTSSQPPKPTKKGPSFPQPQYESRPSVEESSATSSPEPDEGADDDNDDDYEPPPWDLMRPSTNEPDAEPEPLDNHNHLTPAQLRAQYVESRPINPSTGKRKRGRPPFEKPKPPKPSGPTIAKISTQMPTSWSGSPLDIIPRDIAKHRQQLFELDMIITLVSSAYDVYWPYVDNLWQYKQKTRVAKDGTITAKAQCRLGKFRDKRRDLSRPRVRNRPEVEGKGTCEAHFVVTVSQDGTRRIERGEEEHNHTLDKLDSMKRPTAVRNLTIDPSFKGWDPPAVFSYLREQSQLPDGTDILADAGGKYLNKIEIRNSMAIEERKAPTENFENVQGSKEKYHSKHSCSYKGCLALPFPDVKSLMEHRKKEHGFKQRDHSHQVYRCIEKGCWARKRCKGFTNVMGLDNHVRKNHNRQLSNWEIETFCAIAPSERVEDDGNDNDFQPQTMHQHGNGVMDIAHAASSHLQPTPAPPPQVQHNNYPINHIPTAPMDDADQFVAQVAQWNQTHRHSHGHVNNMILPPLPSQPSQPTMPQPMPQSDRSSLMVRVQWLQNERTRIDGEILKIYKQLDSGLGG